VLKIVVKRVENVWLSRVERSRGLELKPAPCARYCSANDEVATDPRSIRGHCSKVAKVEFAKGVGVDMDGIPILSK
jgi:hypothetical protein